MSSSIRKVVVVPHTHWDREWYEQEHLFRLRLVETIELVLETLETNPNFPVFLLDGQLGLLDDYLAVRPGDERRIKALAKAGRLLLGPWYVLADEFLLTDECLTRNLMLGRLAGDRFGQWLAVGYCPDSFGHPANVPAILNGFGIEYAIVWRGYGGRAEETGDLFRWNSPDGSSVVVCHLAPDGYELGAELPEDRVGAAERWRHLRGVLEPRTVTGDVLLPSGADHHGIQPNLSEAVVALRDAAPGVQFDIGSPLQYFQDLPVGAAASLRPVDGELRFSYGYTWTLQGIHSTRSKIKRSAAAAEALLVRWAEPQCALAFMDQGSDRRAQIHDTWREFLRSCAHDSIGGCCTDAVAVDVEHRFARAGSAARALYVDAMWDRLKQDRTMARRNPTARTPTLAVVNPTPRARVDVVEATVTFFRADVPVGRPGAKDVIQQPPADRSFHLVAPDGAQIPVQVTECFVGYDRLDSPRDYPDQDVVDAYRIAFVGRAPPLGVTAYRIVDHAATDMPGPDDANDGVKIVGGMLVNQQLEISGDDAGFSVRDGKAIMRKAAVLVSEIDQGDTYTFQPADGDDTLHAVWSDVREIWGGPFVGCVAREFRLGTRLEGTVYARLDRESNIVHWIVQGDNRSGNHRVRILFPLPGTVKHAVVDQHFGPVVRPRETADPADFPDEHPVRTGPCHRYISVRGATRGLTVFPRGSFEYELMESHVAVTLFRSVGELSKGNLAARPGHAGWPAATPGAQELGMFRVEIGTVLGGVSETSGLEDWTKLENHAERFHAPMAGLMFRHAVGPVDQVMGPCLEGDGLVFKSLKPAAVHDAVVLRCVNVTNRETRGSVRWHTGVRRVAQCRLDESVMCDLELDDDGRVVFTAAAREIISLMFWPNV